MQLTIIQAKKLREAKIVNSEGKVFDPFATNLADELLKLYVDPICAITVHAFLSGVDVKDEKALEAYFTGFTGANCEKLVEEIGQAFINFTFLPEVNRNLLAKVMAMTKVAKEEMNNAISGIA